MTEYFTVEYFFFSSSRQLSKISLITVQQKSEGKKNLWHPSVTTNFRWQVSNMYLQNIKKFYVLNMCVIRYLWYYNDISLMLEMVCFNISFFTYYPLISDCDLRFVFFFLNTFVINWFLFKSLCPSIIPAEWFR